MSRVKWDETGERLYETGVKNCVLYPKSSSGNYKPGVAWNGITAVSESPSGAEANPIYADDIKYLNLISAEDFGATIEAYMYPDEFAECDGSVELVPGAVIGQQARKTFGLCYRTVLGNDEDGDAHGYKLHLIYGCNAAPSEKAYATINDSPEAVSFSWELSTTPVTVNGHKPTATVTIDSTKFVGDKAAKLKALEDALYGIDTPAFSAEKTYAVGDYVSHSEAFYKCTTAVSVPGEWDESDWTEVEEETLLPYLPLPDEIVTLLS